MTNEEARQRGVTADRLLKDEAFQQAIEKLQAEYTTAWQTGKTVEQRESAHAHYTALQKVVAHLRSAVTTGNEAEKRIKEAQGVKPRWF